ncbi:MAG: alpha-2-macroglobulin family protein, partial [Ignavibacteria bacterium]|nr:alpha-2-macroglobulin family protein [Ignavibacteria bacterium]
MFKKHSSEQVTPFLVGNGFTSIKVIKKDNIIPVTISAPEKIKPNTVQNITIKTSSSKNVFVTVAAVDEGILQITDYKTPDPFNFMYAKRPLNVNSYNLYKLLLPEIVSKSSSTGGDGMDDETKKRTNPISVKRIKLLSYWSGIKQTDSNGELKISLNIPQFNGNVRLMAVAYSNSRFGSSEKAMLVADDIIIEPQIPRFLSINDLLIAPVTVLNTTDKTKEIKFSLKLEGPLKSTSINETTIKIKPKSSEIVVFNIAALSEVGAAKIIFTATGQANAKEEIDIAVRPISPLVVENGSGIIKANQETKIDLPKNFLQGTQNTSVTISRFPAIKYTKQLKYLIGYPHGCIEQTVSKLFPQLYFEDLAKLAAPDFYKTTNPVYYVKEGIKKIESMQLYDGSISYWQGESYTNWWGSVYAAHFLVEAQKAKYNVSESVLKKLLAYLSTKAKEQNTYNYVSYSSNGARSTYTKANKEILYSLYILALAKREDIPTMNYYKSRLQLLTEDSRYLLAGAFALAGRWNSYYEIVPNSYEPVHTDRQTGDSFDSDIRSNAIMLNVLLEVEPTNKQVPLIVNYLTKNLPNAYSTQEQSFTFLALGKAAKNVSGADIEVDVIANGKSLGKFVGIDITIKDSRLNTEQVLLKAKGKGEIYYFWGSEGIKINEKVKEEDSNLRVRREFFNYKTKAVIQNNTFTQGDLVICKLTLYGMSRSAENIVITDLIP